VNAPTAENDIGIAMALNASIKQALADLGPSRGE
jgi:hypothetical protein